MNKNPKKIVARPILARPLMQQNCFLAHPYMRPPCNGVYFSNIPKVSSRGGTGRSGFRSSVPKLLTLVSATVIFSVSMAYKMPSYRIFAFDINEMRDPRYGVSTVPDIISLYTRQRPEKKK